MPIYNGTDQQLRLMGESQNVSWLWNQDPFQSISYESVAFRRPMLPECGVPKGVAQVNIGDFEKLEEFLQVWVAAR